MSDFFKREDFLPAEYYAEQGYLDGFIAIANAKRDAELALLRDENKKFRDHFENCHAEYMKKARAFLQKIGAGDVPRGTPSWREKAEKFEAAATYWMKKAGELEADLARVVGAK